MTNDEPNCVRRLHAALALLRNRPSINETFCFAEAIEECTIALKDIPEVHIVDVGVDHAIETIREAIDCGEITLWDQRGKGYARAEQLSPVERAEFEEAIGGLLSFLVSAAGSRLLRAAAVERGREGAA